MKSRFCSFALAVLLFPGIDAWSANLGTPGRKRSPSDDGLAASAEPATAPLLRSASLLQPAAQAAQPTDDWQKRWDKAAHKKNTGRVLMYTGLAVVLVGMVAPYTFLENDPAEECAGRTDYIACEIDESYNTTGLLGGLGIVLAGGVIEGVGISKSRAGQREMNALQRERQTGASQTSLTIPLWRTDRFATELRARVGGGPSLALACSW